MTFRFKNKKQNKFHLKKNRTTERKGSEKLFNFNFNSGELNREKKQKDTQYQIKDN